MLKRHRSILDTIGNTPVVRINHLAPEGIELFAKLEAFNPMGSVKDRIALSIIEDAERRGLLKPGQTVIEATSGNTGIALAMVCAQKGYPLVVVMAENFSIERRRLMRFLGARVVLTPAAEKGSGMFRTASALAAQHGWFLCNQFGNAANPNVHFETTANEILAAFEGTRLDHIVLGAGTGGTAKGVATAVKRKRPETRISLCEPANSPLLALHAASPSLNVGPAFSSTSFRPHPIQGWSPDFVPTFAAESIEASYIDELVPVEGAAALQTARDLARREGIFCGISSGATLAGALDVCRRSERGSHVLCLLPDTGERYQSTVLFDGIETEMSAEESEIYNSVSRQLQVVAMQSNGGTVPASINAITLDKYVSDPSAPVVMFGLQWCEFSWSLRKFLKAQGIAFTIIELDAVDFTASHDAVAIREALKVRTGTPTIPQLFIAGEHVGGCVDTFAAWHEGRLQDRLERASVPYSQTGPDPKTHLPAWLSNQTVPQQIDRSAAR